MLQTISYHELKGDDPELRELHAYRAVNLFGSSEADVSSLVTVQWSGLDFEEK